MALRDGRFENPVSESFGRINPSIHVDRRLFKEDIRGSIAYAGALGKNKIISREEEALIVGGLSEIEKEIEEGGFPFSEEDEDIHMNVERRLFEKIGEAAYKLHTGRSRNEQIVLDEMLYLKKATSELDRSLKATVSAALGAAKGCVEVVVPSYTHLRRAQPASLAHLFLAYCHPLQRARERCSDYWKRLDRMPLGSGAVAGSALGIDRAYLADKLGFSGITENSIDAVSTRDFILEFVWICAEACTTLSRISEDLIILSSEEFGFLRLPDGFCTTSSLMPQKANPDALELVRGKSSRVTAALVSLFTLLKGLPYSYDRDLQEDKEPMFDAADTTLSVLGVVKGIFEGLKVNEERIKLAVEGSGDLIFATDVADWLVRRGIPFREAHRTVGKIVGFAVKEKKGLRELSVGEYRRFCGLFDESVYDLFDYRRSVDSHDVPGGTAFTRVREQIGTLEKALKRGEDLGAGSH
ncbi:MAG: argininosuccinate lyase [Spirochaetes bacterium]|nr:argininosuccinate lyase [Spirochaetota bacterium]